MTVGMGADCTTSGCTRLDGHPGECAVDPVRLDPGIRRLVQYLRALGVPTCDSGDGTSKAEVGCALGFPHVFASYPATDVLRAMADARSIAAVLPEREGASIEVTYSPRDGQVVLAVYGYSDEDLS